MSICGVTIIFFTTVHICTYSRIWRAPKIVAHRIQQKLTKKKHSKNLFGIKSKMNEVQCDECNHFTIVIETNLRTYKLDKKNKNTSRVDNGLKLVSRMHQVTLWVFVHFAIYVWVCLSMAAANKRFATFVTTQLQYTEGKIQSNIHSK